MNLDKVLPLLKDIEDRVSQVRDLLFCPEGIRVTAIYREDFSYVEYWDGDSLPRILGSVEEKIDPAILQQWVFEAIGSIPPSACENKKIAFHTDVEVRDYSEGIQMAVDIFLIEEERVTDELIRTIKERHDFNNYMSQLKRAPDELKKRLQLREDNRLPNSRPGSP